jgi:FtsZ-binding cell division protein ZapB
MNAKSIDELRAAADAAEHEAQEAMRDRKAAIARSAEALRKAGKARQKLVRALGAQGEVRHRRLTRLKSPDTGNSS